MGFTYWKQYKMNDIVERLRCFKHPNATGEELMQEAANEIERLNNIETAARAVLNAWSLDEFAAAKEQLKSAILKGKGR
jgi:hypothetical protein